MIPLLSHSAEALQTCDQKSYHTYLPWTSNSGTLRPLGMTSRTSRAAVCVTIVLGWNFPLKPSSYQRDSIAIRLRFNLTRCVQHPSTQFRHVAYKSKQSRQRLSMQIQIILSNNVCESSLYNGIAQVCPALKVLGKSVGLLACAKLQRERINCISVYLFLNGESSVKISTQTDSYQLRYE